MGRTNVMDYVTIATAGACADWGDYSSAVDVLAMGSQQNSDGRAVGAGGYPYTDVISYFNIGTDSSTTTFGSLATTKYSIAGFANSTRALFGGGQMTSGRTDTIDFITFATTGTRTTFGSLHQTQVGLGGVANATRGIFCGGYDDDDTMEYFTIATESSGTDFGNLSSGRNGISGVSDATRGCICGGSPNTATDEIQYVTIDTEGDAADFGDLVVGHKRAGSGAA